MPCAEEFSSLQMESYSPSACAPILGSSLTVAGFLHDPKGERAGAYQRGREVEGLAGLQSCVLP